MIRRQRSTTPPAAHRHWTLPAALTALALAAIYVTVRPPLFDLDGYMYRVNAMQPDAFYNLNQHHLLWNSVQMALAALSDWIGAASPAPFQLFGVAVNCATLFIFFRLLDTVSGRRWFAVLSVVFVAVSPQFWNRGFQNTPYPMMFLALVVCLSAWRRDDGQPPRAPQLAISAICLIVAIFMQQAATVLVPAGGLALLLTGSEPLLSRLKHSAAWTAAITAIVLPVYLLLWSVVEHKASFWYWVTAYMQSLHGLQFQFPQSLVKAVIGAAGAVVQSNPIEAFLEEHASGGQIYRAYAIVGLFLVAGIAIYLGRRGAKLRTLLGGDALFLFCALCIGFWSAFVIAWEPSQPHFWVVDIFPALTCGAFLVRGTQPTLRYAAILVPLIVWNAWFDHRVDERLARNFPDPLLAAIHGTMGERDIFVVLGNDDWYAGMDYELLFACLQMQADTHGVSILQDFVKPAGGADDWRAKLGDKIEATLNEGGRVFVAGHVLAKDSYRDIANAANPYDPLVMEEFANIDGAKLYSGVTQIFSRYTLRDSDFRIGLDPYFVLERK